MTYTPKKFVKSLAWCLKQRKEVPDMKDELHLLTQLSKIVQTKVYGEDHKMDAGLEVTEEDGLFRIFLRGQEASRGIQFLRAGLPVIQKEIRTRGLPFEVIPEVQDSPPQAQQEAPAPEESP